MVLVPYFQDFWHTVWCGHSWSHLPSKLSMLPIFMRLGGTLDQSDGVLEKKSSLLGLESGSVGWSITIQQTKLSLTINSMKNSGQRDCKKNPTDRKYQYKNTLLSKEKTGVTILWEQTKKKMLLSEKCRQIAVLLEEQIKITIPCEDNIKNTLQSEYCIKILHYQKRQKKKKKLSFKGA